tara:strand:- start:862 stop:1482 length:621 start_codon:yes stop_codon:yes gene_type:complete
MIEITNEDNMKLMARYPDNHFELAIVDPPYGIETKGNAQDRFRMNKDLSLINDNKPNTLYFEELFRVSKNQIIWGYNHLSDLLPSCREFIFWNKHNPVVTFSDGELAWTSFLGTAKCFDYSFMKAIRDNKNQKIHPTQKTYKLYEWLLTNYAKENDKILDTHLGSGSIAIACHNMKYDLTACELDTEYYNAALKRLKQHTDQQRLF